MEQNSLPAEAGETVSLRAVLDLIGDELREMGRFADRFQASLSPALTRLALDPQCHRDVQSLDLLSQCLTALGDYILQISRLVPAGLEVEHGPALASIPLAELQYRLRGAPPPECEDRRSGELELF
ncbi:hypothetical protein [Acidocella sp.]|uniref:hypothetical protein n=1 Tax=Acidocella sp. TaxID=50710 RepID=UPI00260A385C|nr:hypothetical protein [Acidocella sp.]